MAKSKREFDLGAFYSALEGTMISRGRNWKQVAAETGVHASTLSRMARGQRPDASSLAALSAWAGLNPANFVPGMKEIQNTSALAEVSAFLHSDPRLSKEAAVALDSLMKSTYERLANPPKDDS